MADDLRDYFSVVPGSSNKVFPSLKVLGWVTVPFLTPEAGCVLGVSNLFLTELLV